MDRAVEYHPAVGEIRLSSGRPSQGQEIDGEAGEIPARYRHCDSGLREQDGQPDHQPEGVFRRLRYTDIKTETMLHPLTPLRGTRWRAFAPLASSYSQKHFAGRQMIHFCKSLIKGNESRNPEAVPLAGSSPANAIFR